MHRIRLLISIDDADPRDAASVIVANRRAVVSTIDETDAEMVNAIARALDKYQNMLMSHELDSVMREDIPLGALFEEVIREEVVEQAIRKEIADEISETISRITQGSSSFSTRDVLDGLEYALRIVTKNRK